MVTAQCPVCGAVRRIGAGDRFPSHPMLSAWPVFRWCVHGDMSGVIVGVTA